MSFETYGPFNLINAEGAAIDTSSRRRAQFWEEVEAREQGLSGAYGCFLFSALGRGRSLPWFVGRAASLPFSDACFSPPHLDRYRKGRNHQPGTTPHLLLIANRSARGEFGVLNRSQQREIRMIESYLVGLSLNRNPLLLNDSRERYRKYAVATEIMQTRDRATIDQRALRQVLGLV